MADISLTSRLVKPLPGAVIRPFVAGGSGNIGDVVYVDSNGYVQQADGSAEGTALGVGIVVAQGGEGSLTYASGDALSVVVSGPVTGFSGMTPGSILYVSDTAGALADAAGTNEHKEALALSATEVLVVPSLEVVAGS